MTEQQRRTLFSNVKHTVKDVFVQINHAQGVKGPARTTYYKVAYILMSTAVEAVLHSIVATAIEADPNLVKLRQKKDLKKIHALPTVELDTTKKLFICEEVMEDFKLNKMVLLGGLNAFAKDAGLINASLYRRIDNVRRKRNEIHLQGLSSSKRSYTGRNITSCAKVLRELLDIKLS